MYLLEITKNDSAPEYIKAGKSFIEASEFLNDFVKINYTETSFRKITERDQFSVTIKNPRNLLGLTKESLKIRIVKPEAFNMTEIGLW